MEENTNVKESVTTRSIGIRFGLIMALVSIAYFVILNTLGVDMSQGFGRWGSIIYVVAIIFLAHKAFKEQGDGFMSYGQGIGISFWISLISSVISSIFTYFYVKFIDLSYLTKMMDKQREAFEAQGMADQQIDQAMTMTARFMTPEWIVVFGVVFGIIFTVIVALIITIFTQKKNPDPFVN